VDVAEEECEDLVLGLLADARDDYLSGEMLSDKLGLSPASLFKQINGLRAKGYRIDAVAAHGYRLVAVPDRLTALEIEPLLTTHDLGRTLHSFPEVDSTNQVARSLADEGALNGELVLAESQRSGRGRRGRSWISTPGKNLTFSLILRPPLPAARAPEITLTAAVAVAEVLERAGFDVRIKWPNDLLIGGRKVAGILTEVATDGDRLRQVILGIGLNVNLAPGDLPPELRATATSLREERGEPLPRAFLLAALLLSLEEWMDVLVEKGFPPIRLRWRELSATLGSEVKVEGPGGAIVGQALDLDDDGALRVRDAAGAVHRVVGGEVEELRPR
jgi:BirA family biotin operon repressor/biotin-[acetyl-CoA-carboxylase] ligase